MKVNGLAFRKAREEIRKNAPRAKGTSTQPALGTQEWLASVAKIRNAQGEDVCLSVRSIQYLEKGTASIQTIDAVSPHLGLNGRELIEGYGQNSVTLKAEQVIDLRPTLDPFAYTDTFANSPFVLTIDPLAIAINASDLSTARLEQMSAELKLDKQTIPLTWFYQVLLTPNSQGWLGIEKSVHPINFIAPCEWRNSILFVQTQKPAISWETLVNTIEALETKLLSLVVTCEFENFIKTLSIGLAINELKQAFAYERMRRKTTLPYRTQVDALMWGT